jgi:GntR family transcriptional regulator, carbon starvation induced regulator
VTKRTRDPSNGAGSISGETLATGLYRRLKQDIIRGALTPREWLRIDVLRDRYGTGASPLREALNRLSAEGLVVQQDQRGFVVADIDEAELQEIAFTRCALNEIMLPAALTRGDAAWEERVVLAHYHLAKTPPFTSDGRVNDEYLVRHREFHMAILAPCGSRWLLELSARLFDWTERYQNLALRGDIVGSRDVAAEHDNLAKAILARDALRSIELLNEHVRATARLAMSVHQRSEQAYVPSDKAVTAG